VSRSSTSHVMVHCASCTVNNVDRLCTNTPRSCYQCCTSHADIHTCPAHYQQMGVSDAVARLASGLVHANIIEDAAAGLLPAPLVAPLRGDPPLADGAVQPQADPEPPSAPVAPVLPVPGPPPNPRGEVASALVDVAVSAVDVAASVAVLKASMAAMQSSFIASLAAMQSSFEATLNSRLPPLAAASAMPSSVAPRRLPLPSAVPHRAAVLDRTVALPRAAAALLTNPFDALAGGGDDEYDEDAHEVDSHSHTRGVQARPVDLLPAAFVPTSSGTVQNAQQQLAAIVNGLTKQSSKVKYATIGELDEALDDWANDSAKSGTWTIAQVESVRAYQRLLVVRFSVSEHRPLKDVLEYHRRWCKAVHAGTIDMFAAGAALNHDILYEVTHPLQLGAVSVQPAVKTGKSRDTAAPARAGKAAGSPAVAQHPAGSCAKHPTSTTHTTAECRVK
jgi:hypothetical protein